MESLPITGLESCIPKMQRKLVWDYLWGEVSLLCSQAHNRRKSHWGPKTAFINCDVLFCVGFFSLNILCFLTINHILRQKAFKETGHGVCFRSLAGEAGHQLTAVINPQLSDQSIFLPSLRGRRGRPPAVPAHRPLPSPPALAAPRRVTSAGPVLPCCPFRLSHVPLSQAPPPQAPQHVLQSAEPSHPQSLLP